MERKVEYLPKARIEASALGLLAEYGTKFGEVLIPPVPIDEILESHFGLDLAFDDLPAVTKEPKAMGATWFREREVKVDESLDPSVFPSKLGRFRFTVAHEVGHWELHRHLYLSGEGQAAMFEGKDELIVCRSDDHQPIEWQADTFAGYLLMPKSMVFAHWEALHGSRKPYVAIDEIDDIKARYGLGDDERPTVDIARQMATAFEVSAQAMQIRLIDLGLIRTQAPVPDLFST